MPRAGKDQRRLRGLDKVPFGVEIGGFGDVIQRTGCAPAPNCARLYAAMQTSSANSSSMPSPIPTASGRLVRARA